MCTDERVVKTFKDQKTESKEGDVGDTKETGTALEAEKKQPSGRISCDFGIGKVRMIEDNGTRHLDTSSPKFSSNYKMGLFQVMIYLLYKGYQVSM